MIGTPFVGLKIHNKFGQKGHIEWYDLNTRKKVTQLDVKKWQNRNIGG
jgi:hypothetical protein